MVIRAFLTLLPESNLRYRHAETMPGNADSEWVHVPLVLQTGTCEALRPWALRHTVAFAAEVISLTSDAGALRVQICIVNKSASHPAFWVRLALQVPQEGNRGSLQEGQSSE